jgi:hypothetical protein
VCSALNRFKIRNAGLCDHSVEHYSSIIFFFNFLTTAQGRFCTMMLRKCIYLQYRACLFNNHVTGYLSILDFVGENQLPQIWFLYPARHPAVDLVAERCVCVCVCETRERGREREETKLTKLNFIAYTDMNIIIIDELMPSVKKSPTACLKQSLSQNNSETEHAEGLKP